MSVDGFDPKKFVQKSYEYINQLEAENTKLRQVLHNRHEIIKKLIKMIHSHGIEVTGLSELKDEIVEI
jgi:hypothetical protein